jgi:homoserine O-acetyltransferase
MSRPSSDGRLFTLPHPLILESQELLTGVRVAYRTWGRLDRHGTNAVVVCHALTGNPDVDDWWAPLLGSGRALDPDRDFIICSNILGSCYGTTGPADPATPFPSITIRDIVALQRGLVRHLGVKRIRLVIGGSLGGMQTLEWALAAPGLVEAIAPIATAARHTAWQIAISESQRRAIFSDPAWRDGAYDSGAPPRDGLAVARMIAMISYRSHGSFGSRFGREQRDGKFEVEQWLHNHGQKLVARFDARSYVTLTRAMDSHDVGRGRSGSEAALRSIAQPALVVSVSSDVLYPPVEQEELASHIPRAQLEVLESEHGHDAFLIDMDPLNEIVTGFRARVERTSRDARRGGQRCA